MTVVFRATIIQHQTSKVGHANVGSVALPAVLRAGDTGQAQYSTGSMRKAQYSKVSMQAHSGHVPPVVSVSHVFPAACLRDYQHTHTLAYVHARTYARSDIYTCKHFLHGLYNYSVVPIISCVTKSTMVNCVRARSICPLLFPIATS